MTTLPFTDAIRTLRFFAGEMTPDELGERVGDTCQTYRRNRAGQILAEPRNRLG